MKSNAFRVIRHMFAGLAFSLLAVPAISAATAFSRIVVFGDSLNDSGNMAQFTGGAFPNEPMYVYGRQTNGRVWVEYFAARLGMAGQVSNYAVVGALTKATAAIPTGNVWSVDPVNPIPGLEGTDVATQVSDYLADSGGTADPDAIHLLQGGGNDLSRAANEQELGQIVMNLVESFITLQRAGAKHIMVVNLPDIGKTPRVILAERFGLVPEGTAAFYSRVTAQLNSALSTAIAAYTAPDVVVTLADMHTFMNAVVANPAAYGFSEVQLPYLMAGAGTDPATWLFWDDLHPTTRGHQVFAEDVIGALLERYSPRQGGGPGSGVVNGLRGLVRLPIPGKN
ncbi:MAG: SGNH/GDSL hydrolase family protein [Opitutaceae bacterium]|nr:SGNH/GDSL hydrolase family protein [Opitutaceae bacterium]